MSPEERQLLTGLFDRVRAAAGNPRDKEAETLIADETKAQPYAAYLLAQTVIVQDQALNAANGRLQELETKVRELEAQAASQPPGGFLGGLGALFGGGGAPAPRRPAGPPPQVGGPWQQQPQGGWQQPPQGYPPQGYGQPPQQGPWGGQPGGQGGSFLKGALGTAAGVAGGVLLADTIRGLFTGPGGHSGLGIGEGFGQQGGFGGETIVNNYYGDDAGPGGPDAGQDVGFQDQGFPDPGIQDASDYDSDFGSDFGGDDGTQDI